MAPSTYIETSNLGCLNLFETTTTTRAAYYRTLVVKSCVFVIVIKKKFQRHGWEEKLLGKHFSPPQPYYKVFCYFRIHFHAIQIIHGGHQVFTSQKIQVLDIFDM